MKRVNRILIWILTVKCFPCDKLTIREDKLTQPTLEYNGLWFGGSFCRSVIKIRQDEMMMGGKILSKLPPPPFPTAFVTSPKKVQQISSKASHFPQQWLNTLGEIFCCSKSEIDEFYSDYLVAKSCISHLWNVVFPYPMETCQVSPFFFF